MVTFAMSRIQGFESFPIMNPKSDSSKTKQNNSTELSGNSFHNIYSKNDLPDTLDPNPDFSWISRIFYRISFFLRDYEKVHITTFLAFLDAIPGAFQETSGDIPCIFSKSRFSQGIRKASKGPLVSLLGW